MADCNNAFYGINCTKKCNKRCINENCHHETGDCIDDEQVCYMNLLLSIN